MGNRFVFAMVATTLAVLATGCATKRYVREQVDPVSKQVGDLDKRSAENASAIQTLEEKTQRGIARVDEKIGAADTKAAEAARTASEAGAQATRATEKADAARGLAESGVARADRLEKVVENLDRYRLSSTTKVYFAFDRSDLTDEAKKDLSALAQSLANQTRYLLEVQGFTDATGTTDYNYALSEKRADTVTRYLTSQHKIPVYRIHSLGQGKDMPAEGANRLETRRLSRRVEVRVYTPGQP